MICIYLGKEFLKGASRTLLFNFAVHVKEGRKSYITPQRYNQISNVHFSKMISIHRIKYCPALIQHGVAAGGVLRGMGNGIGWVERQRGVLRGMGME